MRLTIFNIEEILQWGRWPVFSLHRGNRKITWAPRTPTVVGTYQLHRYTNGKLLSGKAPFSPESCSDRKASNAPTWKDLEEGVDRFPNDRKRSKGGFWGGLTPVKQETCGLFYLEAKRERRPGLSDWARAAAVVRYPMGRDGTGQEGIWRDRGPSP